MQLLSADLKVDYKHTGSVGAGPGGEEVSCASKSKVATSSMTRRVNVTDARYSRVSDIYVSPELSIYGRKYKGVLRAQGSFDA